VNWVKNGRPSEDGGGANSAFSSIFLVFFVKKKQELLLTRVFSYKKHQKYWGKCLICASTIFTQFTLVIDD
jgi:hypothetical protein